MYADSLTTLTPKKRAQIRGNMRTDVLKANLTWYTFTKNLRVLNAKNIQFDFNCKHIRRHSNHTLIVDLNDDFVTKSKEDESDVPSPLGPFFAQMMFDLGIDYPMFETLLEFFIYRTGGVNTPQGRNDTRAYIRKEFRSPKMSWISLIKGFTFLCVMEVTMNIRVTYSYGIVSNHRYRFALGDLDHKPSKEEIENGI